MKFRKDIAVFFHEAALLVAGFSMPNFTSANGLSVSQDAKITAKIGQCNFRFPVMYGVEYGPPENGEYPQTGQFNFVYGGKSQLSRMAATTPLLCEDTKNPGAVDTQLGAVYRDRKWEAKDDDGNWVVQYGAKANVQVIDLHGQNSSGKALLYNDTIGDEDRRVRHINFCLIHSTVALCGSTYVRVLNRPKIDSTEELKNLIESIEFIDP